MGFEDDFDYNDDFETDIADPDNIGSEQQPKKLSRKELREAKKRNAEKTADLPKHKKGLFGKHERLDDNDESLTDEHIFDPTRSAMISTSRDRGSRERENAPIRNTDSEFSYLFDPVSDDETEDYVYPEKSIYSDDNAAKDLLAGLSYDESRDGNSKDFDRYFDEHSKPLESKFSFTRKKETKNEEPSGFEDDFDTLEQDLPAPPEPKPEPPKPAAVKVVPKKAEPQENDSFLPELRPDSVFAQKSAPEPAPELRPNLRNEPPLPPIHDHADSYKHYDDYQDEDDDYMNQDQDKSGQDYMPYGGMYPSYPMAPMNQMMSYPIVIPSGGQTQQGNIPFQTIPIPYPMPMPMPMPMYGQYPPYPAQYPGYPPQDRYGMYPPDGRTAYDRYDERRDTESRERAGRRFNGHRRGDSRYYDDDRYYDRYDDRYDERYDDRYDDRRQRRYEDRRDTRYEDRRDQRYGERRDSRYDERNDDSYYNNYSHEPERRTFPQPSYEPPYRSQQEPVTQSVPEPSAPVYVPQPSPEPIQVAAPQPEQPVYTPSPLTNFDFTFRKPVENTSPSQPGSEENTPALDGFESGGLDDNSFGNDDFGSGGLDDSSFANDDFGSGGFDDNSFANDDFGNGGFDDNSFANDDFGNGGFDDNSFANDDLGSGGFDDNSFANDDFGSGGLDDNSFGGDNSDEDDFGLGFGNKSISTDRPSSVVSGESKPSGGRFKKKK